MGAAYAIAELFTAVCDIIDHRTVKFLSNGATNQLTEYPKDTDHVFDAIILDAKSFEDSKATAFIENKPCLLDNILEGRQRVIRRALQ